ncbi:MAG: erythromycin esterase family protein [Peptostreptococcaceae bacterium]|nr:erythromycin esterase family protein [Peptostreptococcaceae bacterium]
MKRRFFIYGAALVLIAAFSCFYTLRHSGAQQKMPALNSEMTEQLRPFLSSPQQAALPSEVSIIGFGEATHGNKETMQIRLSLFRRLVKEQGRLVFAIEGDYGGSQRVNDYIHGAAMSAKEAAASIGFQIYRTKEMEDLLKWMREYNENEKDPQKQIRFYGFDMQRYDRTKELLFGILKDTDLELYKDYEAATADLTDETVYSLTGKQAEAAVQKLKLLSEKLLKQEQKITKIRSAKDFAIAKHCADLLVQNTALHNAGNRYGTMRDAYMAENTEWIWNFEKQFFQNDRLFITGHMGHIGKETATFGTEKSMGEFLHEKFGKEYFTVGTEFYQSRFWASDHLSGEYREYEVRNSGKDRLALLLRGEKSDPLWLDIEKAAASGGSLSSYLGKKQAMSSIGAVFGKSFSLSEKLYTQQLSPSKSWDALIYFEKLSPYTQSESIHPPSDKTK